jgi:hypothetical protein
VLKKTADSAWLCAALSLIIGIGLLSYLGIVRGGDMPSGRRVEFSIFAAAHIIYGSLFVIAGGLLRCLRGRLLRFFVRPRSSLGGQFGEHERPIGGAKQPKPRVRRHGRTVE